MNYHEGSIITDKLKKLKNDVKWEKARQEKMKNNILSVMEQSRSNKNCRRNKIIRTMIAPAAAFLIIIGLSVILFIHGYSTNHQMSIEKDKVSFNNATANETQIFFQNIEYEINEKLKQDIVAITDSGFDLKLPASSLAEDMKIVSLVKSEGEEESIEVNTLFSFQDNKQFHFKQKSIGAHNQVLINQSNAGTKADPVEIIINRRHADINSEPIEITINNNLAYLTESENDKSIYLITDKFVYSLHSKDLSTEQMITLIESID